MKQSVKKTILAALSKYHYYQLVKAWRQRHRIVKKEVNKFLLSDKQQEHQNKWQPLNEQFSMDTLNVCYSISGNDSSEFVPEELFEGVIEKKLNAKAPLFLQHKSFYNRLFPNSTFIKDYFHKMDGFYFSNEHNQLSNDELQLNIDSVDFPLIVKKSIDTAGGRDVNFVNNKSELLKAINLYDDLVVQPILKPHPYFQKFHDFGLNTIRACLYRSVKTGKVHLLNTTLRMGRDGHLDNETQGGLVCNIQKNGKLNEFVVDKYGAKFLEHPNSKIIFADAEGIPAFNELEQISISTAEKIPYANLISLDLAMDEAGDWKLIEIGLEFQTIRFAQYAGHPFFGEFTNEVIEYCS